MDDLNAANQEGADSHPVDTLFVDDQQTIFISEVLHILRAELDNFLGADSLRDFNAEIQKAKQNVIDYLKDLVTTASDAVDEIPQ